MCKINLEQAMKSLLEFRREREWQQYHTPKNLSMSIAIEASELMEHFQWRDEAESRDYLNSEEGRLRVQEEIADVSAYLLLLSHDLHLDLNQVILDKIEKNKLKYPIIKAKGKHNKYDQL